jgi:hypothetical protein
MQIGVSAFTLGILYGLQRLMEQGDTLGIEQMERRIASRRQAAQDRVAALERMELDDVPILSPDLAGVERMLLKHVRLSEEPEFESTPSERCFEREELETWPRERWEEAPFELIQQDIKLSEEIYQ